jgi:hypothetical protein
MGVSGCALADGDTTTRQVHTLLARIEPNKTLVCGLPIKMNEKVQAVFIFLDKQ